MDGPLLAETCSVSGDLVVHVLHERPGSTHPRKHDHIGVRLLDVHLGHGDALVGCEVVSGLDGDRLPRLPAALHGDHGDHHGPRADLHDAQPAALLLRRVDVPSRLRRWSCFRSLLESLDGVLDVAEELLPRALLDRHHVGLVHEGRSIVVLGLTDGVVVLADLELHLPLVRDVRLLKLVRLAILDRNVVQVLLRGLGELQDGMTTFILLEVHLELARVDVHGVRRVVQLHPERSHGL